MKGFVAATKGMPKEAWHCSNTSPSSPVSLAQSRSWPPQPEKKSAFTALLRVRVMLRVRKPTKPRAPGSLELQNACQEQHSTAPTLLPPYLSPRHQPCADHLHLSSLSFYCPLRVSVILRFGLSVWFIY